MKTIEADFLILGSGLAGLTAALHLCRHGRVLLMTKRGTGQSNSDWAQGGIACVVDPSDTFDGHVDDTLSAGAGLCKEDVVRAIVESGPERIRELESWGVEFERNGDHQYDLGTEGGHRRRRVLHAGDITGHVVISSLVERVKNEPNIDIHPNAMAIDLVTTGWIGSDAESRCIGAYILDIDTGKIFGACAPNTILATGGAGKVYLYTTNPDLATGDGIATPWRTTTS